LLKHKKAVNIELIPCYESALFQVNQEQLNKFSEVSQGTGKIHLDPEFARNSPFQKTLVHGLYLLAFIEKELSGLFENWPEQGVLDITFIKPVKVDEEFKIVIERTEETEDYKITVVKESGEQVIVGTAMI
jgi:acyl dehydratase